MPTAADIIPHKSGRMSTKPNYDPPHQNVWIRGRSSLAIRQLFEDAARAMSRRGLEVNHERLVVAAVEHFCGLEAAEQDSIYEDFIRRYPGMLLPGIKPDPHHSHGEGQPPKRGAGRPRKSGPEEG